MENRFHHQCKHHNRHLQHHHCHHQHHRQHHRQHHHRHHQHHHHYLDAVGQVDLRARPGSEVDWPAFRHQNRLVYVHLDIYNVDGDDDDGDDEDGDKLNIDDGLDLPLRPAAASTAGENVPPGPRRSSLWPPALPLHHAGGHDDHDHDGRDG